MAKKTSTKKLTEQNPLKSSFLIEVTKEHIKKGKRLHGTSCPISLAVKSFFDVAARTYPNSKKDNPESTDWCHSINHRITVKTDNSTLIFKMPDNVAKKIMDYDGGGTMEPFSFIIGF